MWSSIILYIISNKYSLLFEGKHAHRWLFLRVVPRVFRPVICRYNLKIRKILRMRKICAALAMYSREYWEDRRLRKTETKKGKIPRRSIILRNEMMNSNCKWGKNLWKGNQKMYLTLYGDTMNLIRYSSVNHPTKIASVTLKK